VELGNAIVQFAFRLSEGIALVFAVIAISAYAVPRRAK
jgi:hypothetical protein